MIHSADIMDRLQERLRLPASPSTVPRSLPVLFFGDLLSARVATVGLNPSRREYTDRHLRELEGPKRRFETLASLGADDRASLSKAQCGKAIDTMRGYFDEGKPAYSWFTPMGHVLAGLGVSYTRREACHLDLVQESTDPTWSRLAAERPHEARALLAQDLPFLQWEMAAFPLDVIVCNGRSVVDTLIAETQAQVVAYEKPSRFAWTVAIVDLDGRRIGIVGWNIPLTRPTGLTSQGLVELGETLRSCLAHHGVLIAG